MSHRLSCAIELLVVFLGTASLSANAVSAQQPLEDFLASARSRALPVREARAALDQAEWQTAAARGRLLPVLAAQGTYQRNQFSAEFNGPSGPVVIAPADALSATVSVSVPILDIASWARLIQSGAVEDAVRARTLATEDEVEASVVALWHRLVAARAFVAASQRNLETARRAREAAVARVEIGVASQIQLSRAEAEEARARQTMAETELEAVLAAKSLADLTGLTPSPDTVALTADLTPDPPLARFLVRVADAPQVRAANESRRAMDVADDLSWTTLLPIVSAFARETGTNAPGFIGENWAYALGLTASWQLDFVRPAQMGEAASAAAVARIQAERVGQEAEAAVYDAWHRVQASRVRVEAAEAALAASRRAAEDARAQTETGTGTQLDEIQAERDLFQAEVARVQAIADLRVARAVLHLRTRGVSERR
jgi:outer membrane protein